MSDHEKAIHNCHIHLFTLNHVPDRFVPKGVDWLLRKKWARKRLIGFLDKAIFWRDRDALERYARFAEIAGSESQEQVFKMVAGYYPTGTRFVVLPMDMAFMDAGGVAEDIDTQHRKLADLASASEGRVIPFAAVDPRRDGVAGHLKRWIDDYGLKGVKLYPPQGFSVTDPVLMDQVYPFCVERDLPVMTHCSQGGVHNRSMDRATTEGFADPETYWPVLRKFPELRLCLAHFGGDRAWDEYFHRSWQEGKEASWLAKIIDALRGGEFPNLYTDISYTVFEFSQNIGLLKVLLENPAIRAKVLYGSDFYMAEQEKIRERRIAVELRAALGEAAFWAIAHDNPLTYLGSATD